MPPPPSFPSLLRVYFAYGSAIESKLNCLSLEQTGHLFAQCVLPVLLNVNRSVPDEADEEGAPDRRGLTEGLYRYIHLLHRRYAQELVACGLASKGYHLPAKEGEAITYGGLQADYRALIARDGSQPMIAPDIRILDLRVEEAEVAFEGDEELFLRMNQAQDGLCRAHDCLVRLDRDPRRTRLVTSIGQLVFEVKAYLSHLGRAAWADVAGPWRSANPVELASLNIRRGVTHLERAVLDFSKDAIATIFANRANYVDGASSARRRPALRSEWESALRDYLALRQREHDAVGEDPSGDGAPKWAPFLEMTERLYATFVQVDPA